MSSTEEQKDNEEREGGEPRTRSDAEAEETSEETRDAAAADAGTDDAGGDDTGGADGDDGDEAERAAAPSAAAPAGASAPASAAPRGSAGARLAAAKAAKAAKKAAKKAQLAADGAPADELAMTGGGAPAKDAEEILKESALGVAATKAGAWAQANQALAAGIVGVLIVGALGWVGYSWWHAAQAEGAGALLGEALDIATAPIVREGAEREPGTEDERSFATREARAEEALTAYRRVLTEYPGADAARWARLGEARALFDLGRHEEARGAYETALREAGGDPLVAWRAMEGIGFTYEADQQWDQAIEQYQSLRSIEDGAYEAPADYHIARMRIAKGERVEATTALRGLVERLRERSSDGEPAFPYVMAQAEVRLRELDPGSSSGGSPMMIGPGGPGGAGGLPPGLEGIDPAILEQLRRQLGAQGAGEGEPE